MDVLLSEEELVIQELLRDFFSNESTPELVRAAEGAVERYSRGLWKIAADLGWLGISIPEAHGGQGLPLSYLGLMLEEAGRALAPLPLHGHAVVATVLQRHAAGAPLEVLPKLADGSVLASFAFQPESGVWDIGALGLTGRRDGDGFVLDGAVSFVDNFRNADVVLVAFAIEGEEEVGLALLDSSADGVSSYALSPMAKDSQSHVSFDAVRIPAEALVAPDAGKAALRELMDFASAFYVSLMAGAAGQAMNFAVEYSKERVAFGQPIGAFQAIQHMAADMVNAVDGSQLLVREAMWRLDSGLSSTIEIAQAKAFASEKCVAVCRSAQQVHGGIGFIDEFDLQLWYRRVGSWSMRGGTAREHRARVAAALLDVPGKVRLGMALEAPESVA